jgi:biotin synthase
VASGRGPSDADVEHVCGAVRDVLAALPEAEICACLGLLTAAQGTALKSAGVFAYNHNLNTSESFYGEICGTHTYADRLRTVGIVKRAGLSPCCGALFGMGESDEDIVDVAFELRAAGVDSLPVNFLIPIQGTPLAGRWELTPNRCLKILCLMRLTNPASELRIAGGREHHLKSLQPMGLLVANSIFIGDYLTAKGQRPEDDLQMIRDLGFEILNAADHRRPGDARDGVPLKTRDERLSPA